MAFSPTGTKGFGVSVVGIASTNTKLQAFAKAYEQCVVDEVNKSAVKIRTDAINRLTRWGAVDMGRLRSSIVSDFAKPGGLMSLKAKVFTNVEYAWAVEFGRRAGADPPPVKPIREWCKRNGIPEAAAYAIAKSIGKKGIKPKPYLIPAMEKERPKLFKRLNNCMAKAAKKAGGGKKKGGKRGR